MGGLGSGANQCLTNVNNENSHLSINPEYLSSFSDIENIREYLLQNTHMAGTTINEVHNSGLAAIENNSMNFVSR